MTVYEIASEKALAMTDEGSLLSVGYVRFSSFGYYKSQDT